MFRVELLLTSEELLVTLLGIVNAILLKLTLCTRLLNRSPNVLLALLEPMLLMFTLVDSGVIGWDGLLRKLLLPGLVPDLEIFTLLA